jgi:CPA2 family monovalent cation:H+ antiporter-2
MPHDLFTSLLILLGTAVVVVWVFRRLRLSPILGYLVVGALVGPHGFGWLPDNEQTRFLAELGVVFLLFTVGLEFTLPELLSNRRLVLGLGGSEVLAGTALAGTLAWWLGVPPLGAALIGGAFAMSSTAIVIRQLAEQMELQTRHGRAAVAVLLLQDLATLPFLILLGSAPEAGAGGLALVLPFLKGAAVFTLLYLAGRWLARPLLHWVASAHSNELFMLFALLIVVASAGLVHMAGLSAPLGAFLAGMVLGETEFRHQVEADVRPFQEVLLGLFFATIGMLLDVSQLLANGLWIALAALALVLGKGVLVAALARLVGERPVVSLRTAACLAQGGEFGLLLVAGGLQGGLIPERAGQTLLAAIILSMALAPVLVRFNGAVARWLTGLSAGEAGGPERLIEQEARALRDHVIIVGYARIGQNVATLLQEDSFDFVALDLDPARVREAREMGQPLFYGDATREPILRAAGVDRARALVITHDRPREAVHTVALARRLNPDLVILVRTRDDTHLAELLDAGATEVLPEGLEASLLLGAQLLVLLGRPESEVAERVAAIRADRYHLLREFIHGAEEGEEEQRYQVRLHAVPLPRDAFAVGRRLADLDLGGDVEVSAVRRAGITVPAPTADARLREGDVVLLRGRPEALERAEAVLLTGAT